MANEARVAAVLEVARENLSIGRRYHDVIRAMSGLSRSAESESMAFEAIDGLIAVDVHHSSDVIFRRFDLFVVVLRDKGVVSESVMRSREQASEMAKEALIASRPCDVIDALAVVYNYDGKLSASDWEKVHVIMPRLIEDNKMEIYTVLIDEGDKILKMICNNVEQNCHSCAMA